MRRLAFITVLLFVLVASPAGAASSRDKSLWKFADSQAQQLDRYWDPQARIYQTGSNQIHTTMSMLYLHASAAIKRHKGPSRKDERIEAISRRLTSWPSYITDSFEASGEQAHAPGFTLGIDSPGQQHVSFDTQAAIGLAAAVQSGKLDPDLEEEIAYKLKAVATSKIFSFPSVQLNQVNWPIQVWRSYAIASGKNQGARNQIRRYIRLWVRGMSRPMPGEKISNLSRGLGLRYNPGRLASGPNLTSTTEYANVIYSGLAGYDSLVDDGMKPLSSKEERELRRWARRIIYADWTHSGWPNWDTAHGFERWHLWRYWAWSAEALVTMASSSRLADPSQRAQAAFLLDKVLGQFTWMQGTGLLSGSTRYGLQTGFGQPADDLVTGARLAALAARAVRSSMASQANPRGWYWWDPDMKRLAVSSPRYSAAVMAPISTPAYGGIELSRLLDSQGRVLTGLGIDGQQGGLDLGSGRATQTLYPDDRASFTGWMLWGSPSGDLGEVQLSARSSGMPQAQATHTLQSESIISDYKLKGTDQATLSIPLWGKQKSRRLTDTGGQIELTWESGEGAKLKVIVESPGVLAAELQEAFPTATSPGSEHRLIVELTGSSDLRVYLYPLS